MLVLVLDVVFASGKHVADVRDVARHNCLLALKRGMSRFLLYPIVLEIVVDLVNCLAILLVNTVVTLIQPFSRALELGCLVLDYVKFLSELTLIEH